MKKVLIAPLSLMQNIFNSTTKKVVVMIILLSMLLNGFVPASQQKRNSLFLVATVTVTNSIFEIVHQYQNRLTEISNNLAKDLYKFLFSKELETTVPYNKTKKENSVPINTSNDVAVVIERDNSVNLVIYIDNSNTLFLSLEKVQESLYVLYQQIKDCCSNSSTIGILFFILFVITIRNRKEELIKILSIQKVIENKTNLR